MELAIHTIQGTPTGRTITLSDNIFKADLNDHAIYLDVKQFLANQRQGTHKTKERAEIKGSTRKLKKQKGTGGARAGSIKSPLFRGGGRVFGPRPRDYRFKLNKKLKLVARKSALSYKAQEANIIVVEDFNFEKPNTKQYIKFLSDLSVTNVRTLLLTTDVNHNVYLSSRNLQKTEVKPSLLANTYEILKAKKLILTEGAVAKLESVFKKLF
jgi:large subunit ribosomal protein L4